MLHDTAPEELDRVLDRERGVSQPDRRHLIAACVLQRHLRAAQKNLAAFTARQLQIETEALLEQLQIALHLQRLENSSPRARSSLLLATLLSARQLLSRYREQRGRAARCSDDYLYSLESQVDALYLALSHL